MSGAQNPPSVKNDSIQREEVAMNQQEEVVVTNDVAVTNDVVNADNVEANSTNDSLLVIHREKQVVEANQEDDRDIPEYLYLNLPELRKSVTCPICLGIMRNTKVVMECLHRFCGECIEKAIQVGKTECPVCRRHCPNHHSLRDDPNFDAMIVALFENIDEYEAEEELSEDEEETSEDEEEMAEDEEETSEDEEEMAEDEEGDSDDE